MIRILELFAGAKSFSRIAETDGHETFTVDVSPEYAPDLCLDILDVSVERLMERIVPDVIWASPPCTSFSVASIGHHWNAGNPPTPKTPAAEHGMAIAERTMDIITRIGLHNPNVMWYVENPRGMMRRLACMERLERRVTVTYCQYGDPWRRMKPTDIWTNDMRWNPRPACKNGAPCHVAAPRGSRTGTQGIKGNIARSAIPESLCREILASAIERIAAIAGEKREI